MTAIILFRYHRDFDVCVQTLKQLRRLNPKTQIHGMFGGNDAAEIPATLLSLLDSNWTIPLDDPFYKWKNGDLCVRLWFKHFGQSLTFDHAHLIEWDMLLTRSLLETFGTLQRDANYTTIFGDYKQAKSTDWWWVNGHYGTELEWLLLFLSGESAVDLETLQFGTFPASIFCRKFLELYAQEQVPSHSNDEVRLSVYSKVFGIPLLDNGVLSRSAHNNNVFRTENYTLTRSDFTDFMAQKGHVFHPLREVIEDLDAMFAGFAVSESNLTAPTY